VNPYVNYDMKRESRQGGKSSAGRRSRCDRKSQNRCTPGASKMAAKLTLKESTPVQPLAQNKSLMSPNIKNYQVRDEPQQSHSKSPMQSVKKSGKKFERLGYLKRSPMATPKTSVLSDQKRNGKSPSAVN